MGVEKELDIGVSVRNAENLFTGCFLCSHDAAVRCLLLECNLSYL